MSVIYTVTVITAGGVTPEGYRCLERTWAHGVCMSVLRDSHYKRWLPAVLADYRRVGVNLPDMHYVGQP